MDLQFEYRQYHADLAARHEGVPPREQRRGRAEQGLVPQQTLHPDRDVLLHEHGDAILATVARRLPQARGQERART